MDAASPAQRANILYDALHPDAAMNTPRAKFITHAPCSHLAPLLRARAVQPSDPRDAPNLHGKTTTFCILAAANNAYDTPALYQATLAPQTHPTPPNGPSPTSNPSTPHDAPVVATTLLHSSPSHASLDAPSSQAQLLNLSFLRVPPRPLRTALFSRRRRSF
jgi:hypothetical protein